MELISLFIVNLFVGIIIYIIFSLKHKRTNVVNSKKDDINQEVKEYLEVAVKYMQSAIEIIDRKTQSCYQMLRRAEEISNNIQKFQKKDLSKNNFTKNLSKNNKSNANNILINKINSNNQIKNESIAENILTNKINSNIHIKNKSNANNILTNKINSNIHIKNESIKENFAQRALANLGEDLAEITPIEKNAKSAFMLGSSPHHKNVLKENRDDLKLDSKPSLLKIPINNLIKNFWNNSNIKKQFEKLTDTTTPEIQKIADIAKPEFIKNADIAKPEFIKNTDIAKHDFGNDTDTTTPEIQKIAVINKLEFRKATDTTTPEIQKIANTTKPDFQKNADITKLEFRKATDTTTPEIQKIANTTKPDFQKNADITKPEFVNIPDTRSPEFQKIIPKERDAKNAFIRLLLEEGYNKIEISQWLKVSLAELNLMLSLPLGKASDNVTKKISSNANF